MSKVYVVVEGDTEKAVCNRLLAPWLGGRGVYLYPVVIGRIGRKGGIRSFESAARDIKGLLKQHPTDFVSTLFDYYGLSSDWPGIAESRSATEGNKPTVVESEMFKIIHSSFGTSFNPERFIPYVQMYEIEALLFSNTESIAETFGDLKLKSKFDEIVSQAGGCEKIDDNPNTAPSKRLEKLFPAYRKGQRDSAHAPIILIKTGLPSIRSACPHFDAWITRLENLGNG